MGMEQRTTTIIRQSGISRRLCTDHEVTDHVQLSFPCLSLSLSLYIYIYIYIYPKKERDLQNGVSIFVCIIFFCLH
jgi:hypothetical protein